MLSERAGSVLNILVNEYIQTATPVASDDIARLSPVRVSSATVRNAMSRLSEAGYISRPHVSAGGIPSDLGYRHYLESLKEMPALPIDLRRHIRHQFGQVDQDVEVWSQQCAATLSSITANLALVTVPRSTLSRLKHIQLVYMEEFLVLLVVVLQGARLVRRVLPVEEMVTQDLLDQAANRLNEYLSGLSWDDIGASRPELTILEERIKRETTVMLREADTFGPPEHYVDGLRRLLQQPEFSHAQRAREVVEMVEERVLLDDVLAEAPPQAGDVTVYVGAENRKEALRPFGVVLCQYGVPGQASGTICVIGPTRMGYVQAIGGVTFLASVMSQLVLELYGGEVASGPTGPLPAPRREAAAHDLPD
ncbi:MAG TPA: heat-inducible transcriptional repressor HrcA [Dehalococcoidia bacterium]|nr:heat-inducible transcriptional repressor HrcA [Dehalococcoidia bacterium]